MIRQPIPRVWRISLSIASVALMLLIYTVLSENRQAAARRQQQAVAESKLVELSTRRGELQQQLAEAAQLTDEAQRERRQTQLEQEQGRVEGELQRWTDLREHPDARDLTVPTWSMLLKDGLIRASTPQGAFKRKEIWIVRDFWATAVRLCSGLALGLVVSVLLGLLMGCYDPVESFLQPPFALMSKVPATAVLPIFFVLVQINFKMYLAIIVFGMLPTLAQAISASVRKDVPEELIFKAYTLGASQFELIWEVVFRQVFPRILDAARLQIGPALVLLVAAEWMVAGEGIGYRLRLFYQRTDMTVVFVYVVILGVVGLLTDYALIWLRRYLCPWFGD